VTVFPALFKDAPQADVGERILDDTESSCFYHPAKRAHIPCDACGRYLCALCDIESNGKHICPTCMAKGPKDAPKQLPAARTTYYDNIAVSLSLLPIITFYFTLITAPIALYIAIRYWSKTQSAIPRSKWRNVAAILFASLEIAGWIFLFGTIFYGIFSA